MTKKVSPELRALREQYVEDRYIFRSGERMMPILEELGADAHGLQQFGHIGQLLEPDPTLPFRRSRNGRFAFWYPDELIERLEPQDFVLTEDEDFVRHDSGVVRRFADLSPIQENSVLRALLRFNAYMVRGVDVVKRRGLDYDNETLVSTVFALRTVTNRDLLGEPALEGVHTDGVDHTMTVMVGSENMRPDSAVTQMHQMSEQTGARWNATDPALRVGSVQHTAPLDTLLVVDNERKHSVSPVHADDPAAVTTRDMLIFFSRRPVVPGHLTHSYDSLAPNAEHPMSIGMV